MLPIQPVLILLLFVYLVYFFRFRSLVLDRVILLIFALGGAVAVISPELITQVANVMGIGRGADLLLYFFVIFCLFRFATIESNVKDTHREITAIVRQIALNNPQFGGGAGKEVAEKQQDDEPDFKSSNSTN